MVQQVIFIIVTLAAGWWAVRQYRRIWRNIQLGQEEEIGGDAGQRWRNVLLVAFGQQKMFKNWLPAIFHLFIYVAFVITQIELIEIMVDGFTGRHRIFAGSLGGFYTFVISTIEVLSLLALIATVIFLARRNLLRIPRFRKPEMTSWPVLDANLILIGEVLLIIGIFSMNSADIVLQGMRPDDYHATGQFLLSSQVGPALFGNLPADTLVAVERSGWWLHYLVVLGFLNYLPRSKHLHILLAFPNTYFARLRSRGQMDNMPEIQQEVRSMLGLAAETEPMADDDLPEFGAKDVFDLSWKTLLDAYTCTECGRCTAVCPANLTGKKLSPRKVMMDIRDRVEEVSQKLESGNPEFIREEARGEGARLTADNFDDGRSLFDLTTPEELHACTTCNACVEACPVLIDPLRPILAMRRYEILTLSQGPPDWTPMFTSLENTGSVWQMQEEREAWTEENET
ncbi:MAG: (Fe-S)-binding protein [Saprospiraceae bacterium]|nr:(Fe-S)-binding protein [Saprospiraceae bacterium]